MSESLTATITRRLDTELRKLSTRERVLVGLAILGVAIFIVARLVNGVRTRLAEQTAEIQRVEDLRRKVLGSDEGGREQGLLYRYLELRARKSALEAQFQDGEIKDGPRSYLENLLRTKAGVSGDYNIEDSPTKEFGNDYEVSPFTIKFTAVSMQGAIDFLRELATGRHPLVITELDLQKGRVGDRLRVTVQVLTIRKVAKAVT